MDDIKLGPTGPRMEGIDCSDLAQDREKGHTPVNMVRKILFS
jgi:hypothetical protein